MTKPALAAAAALALLAGAFSANAQAARLTEPSVRAFIDRQESAWNAQDLKAYFAGFAPDAVFVAQALSSENRIVPYGRSTLAQARRQTLRVAKASKLHEDGMIQSVKIAPDGKSAQVLAQVTARVGAGPTLRLSCLRRDQTLLIVAGRIQSKGQTETAVRCRR
jgi:hypothetical protein